MALAKTGHCETYHEVAGPTTVTTSATANTKGSWTQLFASTADDAGQIELVPDADIFVSAAARGALYDIGVGASGSERVVAADINFGSAGQGALRQLFLRIPAGSRVAMRGQSVATSMAIQFVATLEAAAVMNDVPDLVTTYGAVSASSAGTGVSPSGTNNVYGSWTTITAATTRPLRWLAASLGISTTAQLLSTGLLQVGVGASGSEIPLLTQRFRCTGAEELNSFMVPRRVDLPAGVRLAARCRQSNVTGAIGVVLHGME